MIGFFDMYKGWWNTKKKTEDSELIDHIQEIRKHNNILWMEILRIAIKSNPKKTKKILKKITNNDKLVSKFTEELSK